MLRYLPAALLKHPVLPAGLAPHLATLQCEGLSLSEIQGVGQLLDAIVQQHVPDWVRYFPADWQFAGRALVTVLLRPEYGFDETTSARTRADVLTASPARLLHLYFRAAARKREQLDLLALQVGRLNNTPVMRASALAG